jgi:hypothetical protein
MLDVQTLSAICGPDVPVSQINELTKRHKLPAALYSKDGKKFVYAPVTVGFFEALETLRGFFGEDSPFPLLLAERALPKISALWHASEPIAPDAVISIPCAGATVTIPASVVARAKAKISARRT